MRNLSTGRFGYTTDYDDDSEIKNEARAFYEKWIEEAIAILDNGECSKSRAKELLTAVEYWESTLDAIIEASEFGGTEGLVAGMINSHILMRDMLTIGIAIGERKSYVSTAKARGNIDKSNLHLSLTDRRKILLEVVADVERSKDFKGSKYKEMARRCRERGYNIEHDAVRDKLRKGSWQKPTPRNCQAPSQRRMTNVPF